MKKCLFHSVAIAGLFAGCSAAEDLKTGGPWIAARFPAVVTDETEVVVLGSGFGEEGEVYLGDQRVNVLSWSAEKITVEAPRSATSTCSTLKVVTEDVESNPIPLGYGRRGIWSPEYAFAPLVHSSEARAIWTGREFLVLSATGLRGFRYAPRHDAWLPIAMRAPSEAHPSEGRIFWTGEKLFIWGAAAGAPVGATVDPFTNEWSEPVAMKDGAPAQVQSAAYGADALFVYGGSERCAEETCAKTPYSDGIFQNGSWHELPPAPEPFGREQPIVLWTGNEFLVWGGVRVSKWTYRPAEGGLAYNPKTKTWRTIHAGLPEENFLATQAIWTGGELVVIGRDQSGSSQELSSWIFEPASASWTRIDDGTYIGEASSVIASAGKVVVSGLLNSQTGRMEARFSIYDIKARTWESPPTPERFAKRVGHSVFMDAGAVYVLGGQSYDGPERGGGRYDLETKHWSTIGSYEGEPTLRRRAFTAWTGKELLIFGSHPDDPPMRSGGRYNPATDTWLPIPESKDVGYGASAVWTGSELFAWGGVREPWNGLSPYPEYVTSGATFDPAANAWTTLPNLGAPSRRRNHATVSSGTEVIIWSGWPEFAGDLTTPINTKLQDGAAFNLKTRTWSSLPVTGAPDPRNLGLPVWSGSEMLVLGIETSHLSGMGPPAAAFNPETRQWRAIAAMPKQHYAAYLAEKNGDRIYVLASAEKPLMSYAVADNTWAEVPVDGKIGVSIDTPVVAAPGKLYVLSDWWPAGPEPSGRSIDLATGRTESLAAPCGFFSPLGQYGHFVWTGDRILGWGDGGISWYIP